MRIPILLSIVSIVMTPAAAGEGKGLALKNLPPVIQQAIADNLKGGVIQSIGKEKEDGIEQYEVESVRNGKSRDYSIDTKGNLLVVEEATTMDAVPAAAKAAILKKMGAGKLTSVETFTKTGMPTMYEAAYRDVKGKKHEALFKADGTETKE